MDQQLLVLQAGEPTTTETGCCLQGGLVEAEVAAAAVVVVVEAEGAAGEGEAVAGTLSGCQMEQMPTVGKKETLRTGSLSSKVTSSRVSSSFPGATTSSSSSIGARRSRTGCRSTQGVAVGSRRGSSVLVMARSCSSQSVVLRVAGGAGAGSAGAGVQRVLAEELVMTCRDVLCCACCHLDRQLEAEMQSSAMFLAFEWPLRHRLCT